MTVPVGDQGAMAAALAADGYYYSDSTAIAAYVNGETTGVPYYEGWNVEAHETQNGVLHGLMGLELQYVCAPST